MQVYNNVYIYILNKSAHNTIPLSNRLLYYQYSNKIYGIQRIFDKKDTQTDTDKSTVIHTMHICS